MRSGFARLHPLVDLTFFVLVLAFAMFLSHPAVQLAGLVCATLFALRCTGRGFGRRMAMLLPLMLLAAVVNPLVSHQGVTVLFRFLPETPARWNPCSTASPPPCGSARPCSGSWGGTP